MSFLSLSAVTLVFNLSAVGATLGLLVTGYNVFCADFENFPLVLPNDTTHTRDIAWRKRNQYQGKVVRFVLGIDYPFWRRGRIKDAIEVIFESKMGNVFTKENLLQLQRCENEIFGITEYREVFCHLNKNLNCTKPLSVLRYFDGTFGHIDPIFIDPEFANISQVIYSANTNKNTKVDFQYLLGKEYSISATKVHSSITRTIFLIGRPLEVSHPIKTENELVKSFLSNTVKPILELIRDKKLKDIDLFYISDLLIKNDTQHQAIKDLLLAIGSMLFIFGFMWIQTSSFWITFFGILSIFTSFAFTNLIYRYVLGYEYFGFFHIISIFVILGIGADDIFVFYDSWRLSKDRYFSTTEQRLSYCYKKAAKTTFVTSVTTMAAFLVSGLSSPLLPVSSFGIFSALLIGINYITVAIHFPTVIIVHHLKIEPWWRKLISSKGDKRNSLPIKISVTGDTGSQNISYTANRTCASGDNMASAREILTTSHKTLHNCCGDSRLSFVKFMRDSYSRRINLLHIKVTVVASFGILFAGSVYCACLLQPDTRQVSTVAEI